MWRIGGEDERGIGGGNGEEEQKCMGNCGSQGRLRQREKTEKVWRREGCARKQWAEPKEVLRADKSSLMT